MPIHQLKLIGRHEIAKGTMILHFEKPAGFTFKPGQYGGFTLINPSETDEKGTNRRFSILSTPQDELISIATRAQQSAYKRVLNTMPIGSEIKFAGPAGNFTLHEDVETPAVMIAGGIGVTPFYCMIRDAIQHQSPRKITLFYGNQSIEDTAFFDELTDWEKDNTDHFKLITALATPDKGWTGETGYITHELIKKYIPDLSKPIFYVCGSPAMVSALRETLQEMDIPEDRIKFEDFPGY
jgi:ferredoxin-NADP reductase